MPTYEVTTEPGDSPAMLMLASRLPMFMHYLRTPQTEDGDPLATADPEELLHLLDHLHRVRLMLALNGRVSLRSMASALETNHMAVSRRCQRIREADQQGLSAAGSRPGLGALLAGQLVECALHAFIDDGRALRWFATHSGSAACHTLADHGVNGRHLQDQAAHLQLKVPAGALVTAALSCG